jgi:DNA-binding beta-propeller fold protein YncE
VKLVYIFSFIISVIFFQGCAPKVVEVQERVIVFPPAPTEPRIAYLETYRGEKEDDNKLTAFDTFLGETEKSKNMSPVIVKPYGVSIYNGKIYVVDTAANFVYEIDEKTKDARHIGRSGSGTLGGPVDVTFDSKGIMYVSDVRLKTILAYNQKGEFIFSIGDKLVFAHPTGIVIDKKLNRLYVADTKGHNLKAFDLDTKKLLFTIGKRGKGDGEFNFLTNIAVDRRNNNIVVSDTQNFRIQVFDKDGKFIRKFGKVGDRAGDFARPKGVAVDSEGHIYVADTAFNNVQIFDETGELLLYFGHAGYVEPGTFRLIAGMYIDESDKIIISDGFTGRVQTFQYLSDKWKLENPLQYKKYKEIKANKKIEADKTVSENKAEIE